MRGKIAIAFMAVLSMFVLTGSVAAHDKNNCERKIILFDAGVKQDVQDAMVNKHGRVVKHLRLVNGVVAMITPRVRLP